MEAVGLVFKPYLWLPCGVTWDSFQTVVVIKLLLTSALSTTNLNAYVTVQEPHCARPAVSKVFAQSLFWSKGPH